MLFLEHVSMRYGNDPEILRDISLKLQPGSFHFLTGPSGAGKSSLLRLMYLDQQPSNGTLRLFGYNVGRLPRQQYPLIRRRIGVVFQDFRLLDNLTAFENVALPLKVIGFPENKIRDHVSELLIWVGLADYLYNYPKTLSGGQQQRVAIARAIISRPSLLLADEPTGNLDEPMSMRLMYLFEELNKTGTTVIIATHSENLIERFPYPQLHIDGGHLTIIPGKK